MDKRCMKEDGRMVGIMGREHTTKKREVEWIIVWVSYIYREWQKFLPNFDEIIKFIVFLIWNNKKRFYPVSFIVDTFL